MMLRLALIVTLAAALVLGDGPMPAAAAPQGTLTVAVATFGNERWLPNLTPGAEDVVLMGREFIVARPQDR